MTGFSTASLGGGDGSDQEPLADLARYLRQGVGQEWRAELEATELEIHQHRLRSRTLREVAEALVNRGDLVSMQIGDLPVVGRVVGCGRDYLTVHTRNLGVDARLDQVCILVTRRACGGTTTRGAAPTWRARLTELELAAESVELYARSLRGPRRGKIRVVSADHLWLSEPNGVDCYLPIKQLTAVIRPLSVSASL